MQNNNLIGALALGITLLAGLAAVLAYRRVRLCVREPQDTLRRTHALLQSALDVAHAGSWRIDLTRPAPLLELSERAQRIYGLGGEPGLWPAAQWLIHAPANADAAAEDRAQGALQALLAGTAPVYDATYPFQRTADGRTLWLRDYGQIRRDAAGQPLELLGLVVDITEQKQQEAALYRSTSALQQTMEITQSGKWSVDFLKDKESLHLSRQAQAVLGLDLQPDQHYSLQDMRNNRAAAGCPESIAEVARQYEAVHSGVADIFNTVSAWRRPDNGAIVWTQTTARVRRDAQGRLVELVGVMRDVTKEKEVELQLLRANETVESAARTQRDFLANMSHELRTPLNAVMGLSALALKGSKDAKQQHYLKKIRQAGQHLLNTVTDILDFSAIQSGKLAMEPSAFHLQGLLDKVLVAVRETAGHKGLSLRCRMDPGLGGTLVGDPQRIAQILSHYANNAVKFTDAGDIHITAGLRAATDTHVNIRFAVTDTGIGLTQEQIGRLFTSFTQADNSMTRRHGGSGLGLALCKKLAEAMGGTVGVHSAYGSGSTFTFDVRLRLAAQLAAAPQVHASSMAPHAAEADPLLSQLRPLWGARLLLVEDNEINQQVACDMLCDAGFAVEVAENGLSGIARVDARKAQGLPYDLVLMDVQMPVMDGITATRLLRSRFSKQDLPIVAMTANADAKDRELCGAAGMNGFVSKPIAPAQLWRALLTCIPVRAGPVQGSTPRPLPHASGPEDAVRVLPALRTIAGLDVDVGLLCTNQKPAFYVSMIRKFVHSQAKAIATIRLALQAQDVGKAERVAHTLKGLSGTLGAMALQSSAGALENALCMRAASATQAAMAHTEAVLDRLVQSLQAVPDLIAHAPEAAQALTDTERRASQHTLEHIQRLLQQSDAGVLDVWQNQAAVLHALLNNAADIENAINNFDFEVALQLIEKNAPSET